MTLIQKRYIENKMNKNGIHSEIKVFLKNILRRDLKALIDSVNLISAVSGLRLKR